MLDVSATNSAAPEATPRTVGKNPAAADRTRSETDPQRFEDLLEDAAGNDDVSVPVTELDADPDAAPETGDATVAPGAEPDDAQEVPATPALANPTTPPLPTPDGTVARSDTTGPSDPEQPQPVAGNDPTYQVSLRPDAQPGQPVPDAARAAPEASTTTPRKDPAISAAALPNPTPKISPDRPEGRSVPVSQSEESEMQLSRPTRLRTYPTHTTALAAQTAGRSAANDGPDGAPNVAPAPQPTAVLGRTEGRAQPGPQTVLGATYNDSGQPASQIPQTTPPPVSALALVATATQPANKPDALPLAIAGYSALSAQSPKVEAASIPADPDLDPLAPRPAEAIDRPQTSPLAATRSPARTAEAIAQQLSQIAQNTALHRRDVLLQPEELGRVRLSFQASETAVNVSITVERSDTLDLMRRHIGQLAEEFRALGYKDISFEFAQQDQGDRSDTSQGRSSPLSSEQPEDDLAVPQLALQVRPTTHIDRRI